MEQQRWTACATRAILLVVGKTLTSREKKLLLFVNAYVQEFNATKAAITAGYSAKTATQAGSRLLRQPFVKAEIEKRTKGAMAKAEAAADAVLGAQGVTADGVINALVEMLTGQKVLAKFLKVNGPYLNFDFSGASPEDLAAIAPLVQEIKTDYYTEGRGGNAREVKKVSLKWIDRRSVIELLGRYHRLALWKDHVELSRIFDEEMTQAELLRYAETGEMPERFKDRLKDTGATSWTM